VVPIERALVRTVLWLIGGLLASLPLLLIDIGDDPTVAFLIHLGGLVAFGLALTLALLPMSGADWFAGSGWGVMARMIGSGVGIVVLTTGVVGLVTLASSAALGYDPSTQFLQLLSALDIAWVTAAVVIGAERAWSKTAGIIGGIVMGLVCVWSIWYYLDAVPFGSTGEWVVSGADLSTRVIPFDTAAAIIAVGLFAFGTYRASQAMEQPSAQS
jgi:hypothetical protein